MSEPFDNIPPELWLMLACAGSDNVKVKNLLQQHVNWDFFVQLTIHHRVYPSVYKTLSQLSNSVVPEHALSFLRKKYQENTIHSLSLTGETVRIVKALESYDIRCIVLKGAPLAWRLYGDIAVRPSRDIDILVPFEKLEKAISILKSEGYYDIHSFTSRQSQIYYKNIKNAHHFEYRNSKTNISLDLHWKFSDSFHLIPKITPSIIKKIKVAGNTLPVFSDEEWLLYLMLHGAKHGWFRLRWLVDVAKFIQHENIDWNKMYHLAKHIGIITILHQSLILANRLFAVSIPSNLVSSISNDRSAWRLACAAMNLCLTTADCEIMGQDGEQSEYFKKIYYTQLWPGWKPRFNNVLKPFKPTISDIKLISLPDRFYAAYYFIRPIFWLWRRLRKLNLIRPHD